MPDPKKCLPDRPDHCWHVEGVVHIDKTCCWCGNTFCHTVLYGTLSPIAHGPHYGKPAK